MTAPAPLTAEDFVVRYDEHKTFPFFENEHAEVWGYGHPDKADTARQVAEFYAYTGGDDVEVEACDVRHLWAVAAKEGPEDDYMFVIAHQPLPRDRRELGPIPVTADTPGAFPVWTVSL